MSWNSRGLKLVSVVLSLGLATSPLAAQVANPTAEFSDEAVGEAIPPWFTYLHGRILRQLLGGRVPAKSLACRAEAE